MKFAPTSVYNIIIVSLSYYDILDFAIQEWANSLMIINIIQKGYVFFSIISLDLIMEQRGSSSN